MRPPSMCILLLATVGLVFAAAPTAVTGNYAELRSNEVYTCGCIFSGEQLTSGMDAILAWDITAGEFEGTSLAGTKVVAVLGAPSNLDFEETPRKSILYIDSTGPGARQAVLNLFARHYDKLLGEILAVRPASVRFEIDAEGASVQLDGAALRLRKAVLPRDAHPGSYQWYEPFVSMPEKNLGARLQYEFNGEGFRNRWRVAYPPSLTGYFGTFELSR